MAINNRPLTTPQVPRQFLEAAYLTGHIPQRALAADPRISYALYVPPQQYNPDPNGPGNNHLAKLPLLVYLHGTRRNISPIQHELVPFAQATPCAIVAPLFPSNIDGQNDLDSYKLLHSSTLRSDRALLSILDEIAYCWPGIETDKVFLMGFSGGGQFAHRFLYLYPERLAAVSVGAPGRVTTLDASHSWPRGVADVESIFGRTIQKALINQPRIQLVVGSEDVNVHGGKEFQEWVKKMKERRDRHENRDSKQHRDELPGTEHSRLETLRRLHSLWKQDGIEAQLDVVEGVAHAAGGARERVLAFLQPLLQQKLDQRSSV